MVKAERGACRKQAISRVRSLSIVNYVTSRRNERRRFIGDLVIHPGYGFLLLVAHARPLLCKLRAIMHNMRYTPLYGNNYGTANARDTSNHETPRRRWSIFGLKSTPPPLPRPKFSQLRDSAWTNANRILRQIFSKLRDFQIVCQFLSRILIFCSSGVILNLTYRYIDILLSILV